ncbi:MAG: TadE/TadG family type IV pilus assembly protein [Burkholderiaceae bacterium]|jgi:Flp pilus assembly protein TadG
MGSPYRNIPRPRPPFARVSGRRTPTQQGVAALELALLLPLFVALMAAAWDVGRAVQQMERLHHGVRAAVRHLATGDAGHPARQDEARRLAVYGRLEGATTPIVPGLQMSMVNVLEPQGNPGMRLIATAAGPLSMVTVEIRGVRFEPLLLPPSAAFTFRPISLTLAYRFG